MKKNLTTLLIIIGCTLVSFTAKAQLSAAYYDGSPSSKIGIGYQFNENIWTELRLYNGFRLTNTPVEAVVNFSLKKDEFYQLYLGVGGIVNDLNGIVAPLGMYIYPFQKLDNFSFMIELQPVYSFSESDALLFASWGIRYQFKKKS